MSCARSPSWPPPIGVLADLAWGTVLTAAVASAGYGIGRWLGMG